MRFADRLTELLEGSESFRRIMADGIVEDREVEELLGGNAVVSIMKGVFCSACGTRL